MYQVEYYLNRRGEQPVAKWLNDVFKSDIAGASKIDARIQKLKEHGLKLLDTNMMKPIIGMDIISMSYYLGHIESLFIMTQHDQSLFFFTAFEKQNADRIKT